MTQRKKGPLNMWLTASKTLGFTILVPGIEALLIPSLLTQGALMEFLRSARGWHLSGWLFVGFGFLFYIFSAAGFAVRGRGTPAPFDPPKQLVAAGVYSFTRNPMYVGIVSFVFGFAVLSGLWRLLFYSIGLFVFFHAVVVISEEPVLKKQYGCQYKEYCEGVSRWGLRMGRRTTRCGLPRRS